MSMYPHRNKNQIHWLKVDCNLSYWLLPWILSLLVCPPDLLVQEVPKKNNNNNQTLLIILGVWVIDKTTIVFNKLLTL